MGRHIHAQRIENRWNLSSARGRKRKNWNSQAKRVVAKKKEGKPARAIRGRSDGHREVSKAARLGEAEGKKKRSEDHREGRIDDGRKINRENERDGSRISSAPMQPRAALNYAAS